MSECITKIGQKQDSGDIIQYPIGAEGENVIVNGATAENMSLQDWVDYVEEQMKLINPEWTSIKND